MYRIKTYLGFPAHLMEGYNQSVDSSIFQTCEIQKAYFSRSWIYGLRSKKIPLTYVTFENDKPVLFFPSLASSKEVQLAGSTNGICSLCPIYVGDREKYREVLAFFLKKLPAKTVVIDRLMEDSETAKILKSIQGWASVDYNTSENVKINFDQGYDAWHAALRKSVRQNLRTAYNRCRTDGLTVRFEMIEGGKIPQSTIKKLVEIYNNRHESHYGMKASFLKRIYMEKYDFSTVCLKNNSNARHGIIFIENQIAAFFSGYYDEKSKSIVIPRLSIDSRYERYSPGYLLISEAIKNFDHNKLACCLDLSTGCEKYKTDLGGEVYLKGKYIIVK